MAEEKKGKTCVKDFLDEFLTGSETESQTLADFSREIDIIIRGWLLIWKFNDQVYSESDEINQADNWKIVTMILIRKIIFSSKAYLMLFLNGFYHNANIILRSMFETAGTLTYLWKNHELADNWIDDGKVSISTIYLFNVLFGVEGRNPDVRTLYNMLCDDVHSNAKALLQQFYISDRAESYIYLKNDPIYDSELARSRLDLYLAYILLNNFKKYCGSFLTYKNKTEIDEYFEDVMRYRVAR